MPEAEINFEDIAKGNVRIDIVDKLENLRQVSNQIPLLEESIKKKL